MRKTRTLPLIILFSIISLTTLAQKKGYSTFGLGLGLNYGALGGKFAWNFNENFALYGGLGYNYIDLGHNLVFFIH